MVLGLCRVLLRDPLEAEDAAQQAFVNAHRALVVGTAVRDEAAWLATIARNECRARIVRRMREPLALSYDELVDAAGTTIESEPSELSDDVRRALADLPERQREAVILRDVYGLRYQEVGAALGLSRAAVESLLFRARRRLRLRLRPVAGALVIPVAMREGLAQALPGFAGTAAVGAAGASGVIAKLGAAPLAAKVAAGAVAVGAGTGSVAVLKEDDVSRRPPPASAAVRPAAGDPVKRVGAGLGSSASTRLEDAEGGGSRGHGDDGDGGGSRERASGGDGQRRADDGSSGPGPGGERFDGGGGDTRDGGRGHGRDDAPDSESSSGPGPSGAPAQLPASRSSGPGSSSSGRSDSGRAGGHEGATSSGPGPAGSISTSPSGSDASDSSGSGSSGSGSGSGSSG
jgi:RNA polymerase sigma factor (sigma-70 family)